MDIRELVEVSRRYGSDPDMVLAGGGNTSYKDEGTLVVKASGSSLSDIQAAGFASLSRRKLAAIWNKIYPADDDAREAAALQDLMDARLPGEESKRPSVETLMHDLLPHRWVVHMHPSLVNGLTCARDGERLCREIFGDSVYWIPLTKPGFILADTIRKILEKGGRLAAANSAAGTPAGAKPAAQPGAAGNAIVIVLQNHGITVSADTIREVDAEYDRVHKALRARLTRTPSAAIVTQDAASKDSASRDASHAGAAQSGADALLPAVSEEAAAAISKLSGNPVQFLGDHDILDACRDRTAFEAFSSAYTPDHIVYHGARPLWVGAPDSIERAWAERAASGARSARVVAIKGLGVFVTAAEGKAIVNAVALFRDTVKIAIYSQSFGGHLFLSDDMISFIENWEVEKYRAKVSGT